MNYKLLSLCSILIILIILGFIFITREGFQSTNYIEKSNEDLSNSFNSFSKKNELDEFFKDCNECYNIQESELCINNEQCEWMKNILGHDKCFPKTESKNFCNKYIDDTSSEELIESICPYNPNCLGKCIHMLTHTCGQYKTSTSNQDKCILGNLDETSYHKNGELKYDEYKTIPIFNASRCMECVKNFYPIVSLLQ